MLPERVEPVAGAASFFERLKERQSLMTVSAVDCRLMDGAPRFYLLIIFTRSKELAVNLDVVGEDFDPGSGGKP